MMRAIGHDPKVSSLRVNAAIATTMTTWLTGVAAIAQPVPSNIVPDDTLGAERSQVQILNTGERINGGAVRGINLFHSFQEFNVGEGRSTYFIAPDSSIENILTRVTGVNRSEILGRLGTALLENGALVPANANLFLMNPNGIVFGPNSSLDVDRSLFITTANGIQFGEQGAFSASQPDRPSALLTIQPSAFLFNQIPTGNIAVRANQPIAPNSSFLGLRVPNGETLSLIGGNVIVDDGSLHAWGGRLEISALATQGTLRINPDNSIQIPVDIERGNVSIINQSTLDVSSSDGGNITINARNLDISSNSLLQAGIFNDLGSPTSKAGDITLNAAGALTISAQSAVANQIGRNAIGNGGNILINADTVSVGGDSNIVAETFGTGNAGNIRIQGNNDIRLDDTSNIYSLSRSGSEGNSGNVEISARNLFMTGGSQMSAATFGRGNAGNVILNVRDTVSLDGTNSNGSLPSAIFASVQNDAVGQGGNIQITTGSLSITNSAKLDNGVLGIGNGGNVIINARDIVTLSGITRGSQLQYGGAIFTTVEETGRGSAGDIRISTGSLFVLDGAGILTYTKNQGNAGNIFINTRDSVIVDGAGVSSVEDRGTEGTFINILSSEIRSAAQSGAQGNAGNIFINTGNQIAINPTGRVVSGKPLNSNSESEGLTFPIDYTKLSSRASISSAVEENAIGKAGNISLSTGSLLMNNSARVIATTSGRGNSGNINVQARDIINLDNDAVIANLVDDSGIGNGGTINLVTGNLFIKDAAQIDSSTFGQGNAGNVQIEARGEVVFTGSKRKERDGIINIFSSGILSTTERGQTFANAGDIRIVASSLSILDGADLRTITARQGNAGKISIQVNDRIRLANNADINSSTFGQGDAGDITIQSDNQVWLDENSTIASRVEQGAIGNGGNILIDTQDLLATNVGTIEAITEGRGNAGNVTIKARNSVNFSGGIIRENQGEIESSGVSTSVGVSGIGNAGNIYIESTTFSMQESGVNAFTRGQGNSGNITINSRDSIFLERATISSIVGYPLAPGVFGQGDGGTIRLNTNSLVLANGSQLQASTFGQGNAGDIIVNAKESTSVYGFRELGEDRYYSAIFSLVGSNSVGNGGDIQFNTGSLALTTGAKFSVDTRGQGRAGNISINARKSVLIDGAGSNTDTGLFSATERLAKGQGGTITVNTDLLRVRNRGVIDAQTSTPFRGGDITIAADTVELSRAGSIVSTAQGQGNAGNINITANQVKLSDRAAISTETDRSDGGEINLNVADLLLLRRGSTISTTAGNAQSGGNGGNININSRFIVAIPKENSDITANAFTGNGGRITINSQGIFGLEFRPRLTTLSDITASSEAAANGTVTLNSPDNTNLRNSLTQFALDQIDTNKLMDQLCVMRRNEPEGTFYIVGSGGIVNRPNDLKISDYPTNTVQPLAKPPQRGIAPPQRAWKLGDPIVEPTGFYELADGSLVMARECPLQEASRP